LPEPDNKIMHLLERIKSEITKLGSLFIDKLRHMFLGTMSDWIGSIWLRIETGGRHL
jgi:hypothetical protein